MCFLMIRYHYDCKHIPPFSAFSVCCVTVHTTKFKLHFPYKMYLCFNNIVFGDGL